MTPVRAEKLIQYQRPLTSRGLKLSVIATPMRPPNMTAMPPQASSRAQRESGRKTYHVKT
jgi:hypothetical protein